VLTTLATLAGALTRDRQTSAILAMMGVTETIAGTIDTYGAIAERLARDRDFRPARGIYE
jgi:hypothetical protein